MGKLYLCTEANNHPPCRVCSHAKPHKEDIWDNFGEIVTCLDENICIPADTCDVGKLMCIPEIKVRCVEIVSDEGASSGS